MPVVPTKRGDFAPQAEAYARARPGYPRALVDELVRASGVERGDSVVELGAGTGLFTSQLTGRGLRITAIEPSAAMRAQAPQLTDVVWRDGTFERTGLTDESQQWAVAAQAFHWTDPAVALPELRRVLTPGAGLTVLWNQRDPSRSQLVAATHAIIDRYVPNFAESYVGRDWAAQLVGTGDFETPRSQVHQHVISMSCERYLDLWRSHNQLQAAAGPEDSAKILAEIATLLARQPAGEVDVAYVCRVWSASRV